MRSLALRFGLILLICFAFALPALAEDTVDLAVIVVKDRATAKDILQKLKKGSKFEDLANKYSVGPGAGRGGRVGNVPMSRLRPEYKVALRGLAAGKPSSIVLTEGGYTILMRFDGMAIDQPEAAASKGPSKPLPKEKPFVAANRELLMALEEMAAGNFNNSEKHLNAALKQNPNMDKAETLLALVKRAKAGKIKKEALDQVARGLLELTQAEGYEAIDYFKKARKADPRLWEADMWHGEILAAAGKNKEALPLLKRAEKASPNSAKVALTLGLLSWQRKDEKAAENYFRKALKLKPNYAEAEYQLAVLVLGRGNKSQAESLFKKAVEHDPMHGDALNDLGLFYLFVKKPEQAIKAFQRLLEVDPNRESGYVNLGTIYAKANQMDKAISLFERALVVKPTSAKAHANLALAYYTKGQMELARMHASRATLLGHPMPEAFMKALEPAPAAKKDHKMP